MSAPVEVAAARWDALLAELPGGGPYQTARWGRLVSDAFGGTFRVLALRDGETHYVPMLAGGALAEGGFVCGHLGYGGVFHETKGADVPSARQAAVLRALEAELGARCLRYVTPPRPGPPADGAGAATTVLALGASADELWKGYDAKTRNMIRKAENAGLRVETVGAERLEACLALVHATQDRVGAGYRTPRALLAGALGAGPDFALSLGCFLGDELAAFGLFLRHAAAAAYLLNGWSDLGRRLSPNYLLLHAAFVRLAEGGGAAVDLGFSHSPDLRANKERWGGRPAHFHRVNDLRGLGAAPVGPAEVGGPGAPNAR